MNFCTNYITESECIVCGKTFIKSHKSQLICSDECRAKNVKNYSPTAYILSFQNVDLAKKHVIAVFSSKNKLRKHIKKNYPGYFELVGGVKWVSYSSDVFVLLVKKIYLDEEF